MACLRKFEFNRPFVEEVSCEQKKDKKEKDHINERNNVQLKMHPLCPIKYHNSPPLLPPSWIHQQSPLSPLPELIPLSQRPDPSYWQQYGLLFPQRGNRQPWQVWQQKD